MASKKRTPPSLPDHLIFYEIFARLPVKSIHRFRCVSTSCRRLPSDQQFLSAFHRLAHCRLVSRRHYVLSLSNPSQGLILYALNQSGIAGNPSYHQYHCCPHPSIVNGILFRFWKTNSGYLFIVSNPDTGEQFQLPPVTVPSDCDFEQRFYLCHDPEMDKHKVLRTATSYHSAMWYTTFTLGPLSSWGDNPKKTWIKQLGDSKTVCINGTLYLTRCCLPLRNISEKVIGAFTVKSESFYGLSYPAGLSPSRYDQCHLIELKGALAVIDFYKDFYKSEIKLWVKEKGQFELGDQESWTTELRIDFDPRWEMTTRLSLSYSFSTIGDGEITMGVTGMNSRVGCWIFIYNVDKREWRRVEMQGLGDHSIASMNLCVAHENVENPLILKQILN